jgi:hypothetical protein
MEGKIKMQNSSDMKFKELLKTEQPDKTWKNNININIATMPQIEKSSSINGSTQNNNYIKP